MAIKEFLTTKNFTDFLDIYYTIFNSINQPLYDYYDEVFLFKPIKELFDSLLKGE